MQVASPRTRSSLSLGPSRALCRRKGKHRSLGRYGASKRKSLVLLIVSNRGQFYFTKHTSIPFNTAVFFSLSLSSQGDHDIPLLYLHLLRISLTGTRLWGTIFRVEPQDCVQALSEWTLYPLAILRCPVPQEQAVAELVELSWQESCWQMEQMLRRRQDHEIPRGAPPELRSRP